MVPLPLGFTAHSESCHQLFRKSHFHTALYPTSFLIYMHMYATESASQRRSSRSRTTRRTFVADHWHPRISRAIFRTNQPSFQLVHHNHDHHALDLARPSHGIANALLLPLAYSALTFARTRANAQNEPEMNPK